jgi:oligoribonuclease NrnB/cAMP/cGMP phosphodiesterase (DHH superfamily)
MKKNIIVTHVDADGIGSLVNIVRLTKIREYTAYYVNPEDLYNKLYEIARDIKDVSRIFISDLAPNRDKIKDLVMILKDLSEKDVEIFWFDHHIWDPMWIEEIKNVVAKLYLDTSTCATGVVKNALDPKDDFANELEKIICSIDLWRFDDPRSPWFTRIVSYKNTDDWRNLVASKLLETYDPYKFIEWGRRFVEESIDEELSEYDKYLRKSQTYKVSDITVVGIVKRERSKIGTSQLAHYLLSAKNADIAVLIRMNGSISLRSREYNVREIAVKLGGGGHKLAAGGRVNLSLIDKMLMRIGLEKIVVKKILNIIGDIVSQKASHETDH